MYNYGFIHVAAASPKLRVANPAYNVSQIIEVLKQVEERQVVLAVFPELCVTGYTCGDLFKHRHLEEEALDAFLMLLQETKLLAVLALVGMPVHIKDRLFNCALLVHQGKVLGVVPKMYLPNYKEFYEKRWFAPGGEISKEVNEITLYGETVPFGNVLFYNRQLNFTLGVEICEDLWVPIPPSSYMALNGANIVANLSASNELVAKAEYRRQLISQQSARCSCAYVYAGSGVHESTTDVVFGGHCLIAENGVILAETKRFSRENDIVYSHVDLDILRYERQANTSFSDSIDYDAFRGKYKVVEFTLDCAGDSTGASTWKNPQQMRGSGFNRKVDAHPFVPGNPKAVEERCREIFNIQVAGLAKRLEHAGLKHAVIGISGGLDSTLALLVAKQTFDLLKIPPEQILAVTMPGFGTSSLTHANAVELMEALEVCILEIDIKKACLQHFADIGHDPNTHDLTFENVQARERTQILMDLANKHQGLVVGTGDLSELGLGWVTYSGDHMSMYAVNSSVPKTLVKFLVQWAADYVMNNRVRDILYRIINTPISPELLPTDGQGEISQRTEDIIGPYELHDFFLFYTLRYGMPPAKILFLAQRAYGDKYSGEELTRRLKLFYKRFFANQFKRSCLPDGPKVGSVSLSPRGDWRMPSDADVTAWLKELSNIHF
ncbi:MAG: NAD(+) synthase [Bacillota bacterium]